MSVFVAGVYFEEKILTGGLREKIRYWAREAEDGTILIEFLTLNGTSTGMETERMSLEAFQARFHKDEQEAKDNASEETTEERKRNRHVRQGEIHMEKEEFHSAQFEFQQAIRIDAEHVEANFGLGKAFLGQDETEKARAVFSRLVENDNLYTTDKKHIYNELGIELRKQKLYNSAVRNYRRAIEIDSEDAVLYYNLARSLFHEKKWTEAADNLKRALSLDPGLDDALKLKAIMEKGKK